MTVLPAVALSFSLLSSAASPASADDCYGTLGWVLDLPTTAPLGSTIEVCMHGPPDTLGLLMASEGTGPVYTKKYGAICLDFPLLYSTLFTFDSAGDYCFDVDVDFDPELVGMIFYAQFITCHPSAGASNLGSIVVTYEEVCESPDEIDSNFNGTDIAAGNHVWFNAVVDLSNVNEVPAAMQFRDGKIAFSQDGVDYDVTLPDAVILIDDTATEASTTWDAALHQWQTIVPSGYSGNIFLSGVVLDLPSGLSGGVNPVTWSGSFLADQSGVSFKWKWAAAVYTDFATDLADVGVKPIDGDKDNPYDNSDHAGTPEGWKDFVTGGARGGGGSNFTGSYSGTSTIGCQ